MQTTVNMVEAARSWSISDGAKKESPKGAKPKAEGESSYKPKSKGNLWDSLKCSFGGGFYFWSNGKCDYSRGPMLRR